MSLWVPAAYRAPKVSREHADGTAAHNALALSMMYENTVTRHWDPELQRIDPLLCLRRAKEHAAAPGVVADFYHLLRRNEQGPIWVMPLSLPDGSFAEPSAAMLDGLRACDLQNDRVLREAREREMRTDAEQERARERNREELCDEGDERWASMSRTQILMSPDVAWAQNSAGRARPTRGRGR